MLPIWWLVLLGVSDCTDGTAELEEHLERDSACDEDGCLSARLMTVTALCNTETCTWTVESDGQVGTVQLRLMRTGDDGYDESCRDMPDAHAEICGVWGELHESFTTIDTNNRHGGDTLTKVLTIASGSTAVDGETLFHADASILAETTAFIEITDGLLEVSDCAVAGHDTALFEERCPNVWEPFHLP